MNLAYPKGELDAFNRSYPISIQFAPPTTINFFIKTTMTTALVEKTKNSSSARPVRAEVRTAYSGIKPAPDIQTPFDDLMLKPEKLTDVLHDASGTAPKEKEPAAKTRKTRQAAHSFKPNRKKTSFQLAAPSASSVKLVADFTDWEKSPLDLTRQPDGVWSATVALLPGKYLYRFIVDGTWCDDPNCIELIPNVFGSANSVVEIGR